VTEGIEDGLSIHDSTGLGAWAAGSASRMSALSDVVPAYINCATIIADDDEEARRHAAELVSRLRSKQIETRAIIASANMEHAA
jgi:predicted dinucleotide-binding enzyme